MTHLSSRLVARRLVAALAFVSLLAIAAVAWAQAQVVVQVRTASGGPGEATVTLTREGAPPYSCRTSGGTCRLSNVAPGMYVATAQPIGEGAPPVPRNVPVVAGSDVTISLTLR